MARSIIVIAGFLIACELAVVLSNHDGGKAVEKSKSQKVKKFEDSLTQSIHKKGNRTLQKGNDQLNNNTAKDPFKIENKTSDLVKRMMYCEYDEKDDYFATPNGDILRTMKQKGKFTGNQAADVFNKMKSLFSGFATNMVFGSPKPGFHWERCTGRPFFALFDFKANPNKKLNPTTTVDNWKMELLRINLEDFYKQGMGKPIFWYIGPSLVTFHSDFLGSKQGYFTKIGNDVQQMSIRTDQWEKMTIDDFQNIFGGGTRDEFRTIESEWMDQELTLTLTPTSLYFNPSGNENIFSIVANGDGPELREGEENIFKYMSDINFYGRKDYLRESFYLSGLCRADDIFLTKQYLIDNVIKIKTIVPKSATNILNRERSNLFYKETDPVVFISSNSKLEDLSDPIIGYDKIKDAIFLPDGNKVTENTDNQGILPGANFRYLFVNPHDQSKTLAIMNISSSCPGRVEKYCSFRTYFPFVGHKKAFEFLRMVTLNKDNSQYELDANLETWLTREENIALQYYEEYENGGFRVRMVPISSNQTEDGFILISHFPFTRIRKSHIDVDINPESKKIEVSGEGTENILGFYDSSFNLRTEANEIKVTFDIEVSSNEIFMRTLKETDADIGKGGETNDEGKFHTPFKALNEIPLRDAQVTARGTADTFEFVATAKVGNMEELKYLTSMHRDKTTFSCLYQDSKGNVATFLNNIQEKPFFAQSWLEFESIGLLFSSTHHVINKQCCNMEDEAIRNTISIKENVGIIIEGLSLECTINDVEGPNGEPVQSKGCLFLTEHHSNIQALRETRLHGTMSNGSMEMKGENNVTLQLTNSIKIFGPPELIHQGENSLAKEGKTNKEEIVFKIKGHLTFKDSDLFPGELFTSGNIVSLKAELPQGWTRYWTLFPDLPEVRIQPKGKIILSEDDESGDNEFVEFRALTEIRSKSNPVPDNTIAFEDQMLSWYYIDPNNVKASRFFACMESSKRIQFSKLVRVLANLDRKGFLHNSWIKGLCVAYNPDAVMWRIDSIKRAVPKGFSVSGEVETNWGKGGVVTTMPLYTLEITDESQSGIKICTNLPVQKWGKPLRGRRMGDSVQPLRYRDETDVGDTVSDIEVLTEQMGNYICRLGKGIELKDYASRGQIIRGSSRRDIIVPCITKFATDYTWDAIEIEEIGSRWQGYCVQSYTRYEKVRGNRKIWTCTIDDTSPHPIEFYSGKKVEERLFGPEYCYILDPNKVHDIKNTNKITLKGYLMSWIYDKENMEGNQMSIETAITPRANPGVLQHLSLAYKDAEIDGIKFAVQYESDGWHNDPQDLDFTVVMYSLTPLAGTDGILIEDTVLAQRMKELDYYNLVAEKYKNSGIKWRNRILDLESDMNQYKWENGRYKKRFQVASMNRARAVKSLSKDCASECGYVRLPGWNVVDQCSKDNNGRSLKCVKYNKDGNVATNVGCIANCEAERVASYAHARRLDYTAQESGDVVDRIDECISIGQALKTQLETWHTKAQNLESDYRRLIDGVEHDPWAYKNMHQFYLNGRTYLEVNTRLLDLEEKRCMEFKIHLHTTLTRNAPVVRSCFGNIIGDVVIYMYEKYSGLKTRKSDSLLWHEWLARFRMIEEWRGENEDSRTLLRLWNKWAECRGGNPGNGDKRSGKSRRSLFPAFTTGTFTLFNKETVEAFEKQSPWVIAQERDVINQISNFKFNSTDHHDISHPGNDSACSVARRAAIAYNNIASYIHTWSKEHQSAKRTLDEKKAFIENDLQGEDLKYYFSKKNYTSTDMELMQHWRDKVNDGVKEWSKNEDKQIERYNRESLPYLRKQLEFAYTDEKRKTLRDFFKYHNEDAESAFKRANIATTSGNTFSDLSKALLNLIEKGKSLEEISSPVEDIMRRSEVLHKRTIDCGV